MSMLLLFASLSTGGQAAPSKVPQRQVPPSVLVELQQLENQFELALAMDCDAARCFSKGCSYVDHAVADQPRAGSLPGLGQDAGPGAEGSQEYLTQAACGYAHEQTEDPADVQALNRRLQAKLSSGWTAVSVRNEALQPLPAYLREPAVEPVVAPEPAVVEAPPVAEPPPWSMAVAGRELWTTLLPDFFWMIGLGLFTLASAVLIWAWRRVGRASLEEQALLAQLAMPDSNAAPGGEAIAVEATLEAAEVDRQFVAQQHQSWQARLQNQDPAARDPQLDALLRDLLRAGNLPLLAQAVLRFPDTLPALFPTGGDIAAAKLELADYLKGLDAASLPSDVEFFTALNRHALSAALASQDDAGVVRSLREDFGVAGLATRIGSLTPRLGALLFALAPTAEQIELVRLLAPHQAAAMAEQLLRSDRMDPRETSYLFESLRAARGDGPAPSAPPPADVSDRGASFDAAGALSVLLPAVGPAGSNALFATALQRFGGTLPTWQRNILVPDMLFALPAEARADLLLEVDADALTAWLSLLDAHLRSELLADAPTALRAAVSGGGGFGSRSRQLQLADQGRRELARGFQRQLVRAGLAFEQVVSPPGTAGR
jgi:membrane protein implicated in regulation of membrane protease activity